MSWQATEAVQDCEKIQDHTALAIMYAIARHADANGIAGANGRESAPSIDTLAAKSRCHRNTVLNWLPKLEDLGVLKVERFGNGRGSWNRYTILVPIAADNGTSNSTSRDVPKVEIMVQELAEKIELLVQVMVHNGTSWDVPDTKDTNYIYKHPDSEPIAEIKTALAQVTKTPLWEKTEKEYDDAAYMLIGWDASADDIAKFGAWWQSNGQYAGQPALTSLIQEWRNYKRGIKNPKTNAGNSNGVISVGGR